MKKIVIQDPRGRIIKRKKAVSGPRNVNESLSFAAGKYALLCLDKDGIRGELLDDFLNALKCHPEICGGFCTILPTGNHKMEICKKTGFVNLDILASILQGIFIKRIMLKKLIQNLRKKRWKIHMFMIGFLRNVQQKGPC